MPNEALIYSYFLVDMLSYWLIFKATVGIYQVAKSKRSGI